MVVAVRARDTFLAFVEAVMSSIEEDERARQASPPRSRLIACLDPRPEDAYGRVRTGSGEVMITRFPRPGGDNFEKKKYIILLTTTLIVENVTKTNLN